MLRFVGVTKQYLYGARLFGALDLTVADGEIIAVYGDEGAGKTSFLKTAAGAEECEGEVLLDGKKVGGRTDDVIMVFEDGAVFKWRTAFDNLAYPLKLRGTDKVEIASRVLAAAEKTGIGGVCLDLRARSLSAAERRRMSLARLFLRDAKLLVIDEPTAGLSRKEAESLWSDVAPLLKEKAAQGVTVIYSTSSREEALSICDRLVVLHNGEVKQIASVPEILRDPENVWAAQAVDGNYNYEKCLLFDENGALNIVFRNGKRISAEVFRGKIAEGYVGKEVLCGWYPTKSATACGSAREGFSERVVYSVADRYGRTLTTKSGLRTRSDADAETADAYPCEDGFALFDATNENSITK